MLHVLFQRRDEGGILIPVLSLLVMVSVMTLFIVKEYQYKREITLITSDFYMAQVMSDMTFEQIKKEGKLDNHYVFEEGQVVTEYDDRQKELQLEVLLKNSYKRTFSYKNYKKE